MRAIFTILIITLLTTVNKAQTNPAQPNILLIIADDLGVDRTPGYHTGGMLPTTPTLDSLRATGITFENVWAAPKCTPTRGAIMSGKYGTKTGVTGTPGNLDLEHTSIFNAIEDSTDNAYNDAVIGKWHISSPTNPDHPQLHGADYYVGLLDAGVDDYYAWQKTENGITELCNEYTTTLLTDRAIDWRAEQTDKPWFLWWAHAAPHSPLHVPPAEMYTIENTNGNVRQYIAMIESIDYSLNRLLQSIPDEVEENTIIIFVDDNGTPGSVLQDYPDGHGKSTLYQGGVRVPLIISGAGVDRSGAREDALIQVTDFYATILQLTGSELAGGTNNSLGFKHLLTDEEGPQRDYNFVDFLSQGEGGHAIRNERYKLIEFEDGSQEFYDLQTDSLEFNDLLLAGLSSEQQSIKEDLELEALTQKEDWSCRDHIQNGDEEGIDCGGSNCISCALNTENELLTEINIFPNPVSNFLYIESPQSKIKSISIYDLLGNLVYNSQNIDQYNYMLDMQQYETSHYILSIAHSSTSNYYKLIKI